MANIYFFPFPSTNPFRPSSPSYSPPTSYIPPPLRFVKLNFDGASKVNPIFVGLREIFLKNYGKPMFLFTNCMAYSCNNATKFASLETRIIIVSQQGLSRMIMEGHS